MESIWGELGVCEIDKATLDEIINLLTPYMATLLERQTFVNQSLHDAPTLIQQIQLEGNPYQVAADLVYKCNRFGLISPGQYAVIRLLDQLQQLIGVDKKLQVNDLIRKIILECTKVPSEFVGNVVTGEHYFISYARANLPFVQRLARDLQQHVKIWIDKIGLQPGTPDWEQALRNAISASDGVVFVASPSSRQSSYVRDELAIAQMENKPIYPVWAEGTNDRRMDSFPIGFGFVQTEFLIAQLAVQQILFAQKNLQHHLQ